MRPDVTAARAAGSVQSVPPKDEQPAASVEKAKTSQRLQALDVFRGFNIALMVCFFPAERRTILTQIDGCSATVEVFSNSCWLQVLVDDLGSAFPAIHHSPWDGQ